MRQAGRYLAEYRATVLNADDVLARQPRFRRETGESRHPHAYDAPNRLTEFGYLADSGLIPLSDDERRAVQAQAKSLAELHL